MHLNETTLVHLVWQQVWQCSLLVLVVFLVCKLIRFHRAHLTFLLWFLVLIKFMTPPLWSSSSGLFCWVQESLQQTATADPLLAEEGGLTLTESIRQSLGDDLSQLPALDSHARRTKITVHNDNGAVQTTRKHDSKTTTVLNASENQKPEIHTSAWTFFPVLLCLWLGIAALILTVMGVRYGRCWIMLRRSGTQAHPELETLLARLCDELQLKRRVRLLVTNSRLGPAVIGLFYPLIVLPTAITHARTIKDLEPILAHELIHIRRGDLWFGLFQLLTSVVWWFHPLVWFTGRRLKLEIEQCCDEEVLAGLNCDPRVYAKCLLEVLELKQTLNTVPVVPGVRPVEITSKRLERIMKLGQGCQKRTPWWCWLVFVMLSAIVLPGAAFVVTAADPPERLRAIDKTLVTEKTESTELSQQPETGPIQSLPFYDELKHVVNLNERFRDMYSTDLPYLSPEIDMRDWVSRSVSIRVYPIKELLEQTRQAVGAVEAELVLEKKLNSQILKIREIWAANQKPASSPGAPFFFETVQVPLKDERKKYKIVIYGGSCIRNDHLIVWAKDELYHRQVEQALADLKPEEISPLELKTKLIAVPRSLLDQISSKRKNTKVFQVKQVPATEGAKPGELVSVGPETVSRTSLVCEVLDQKRFHEIQQMIQSSSRSQLLSAPQVRFMDGQSVQIETKKRSEFKSKFKGRGQQFSVVNADVGLDMNVTYSERKGINQRGMLEYQIAYSEIGGLKKQKVLDLKIGEEQEIEVPLVVERRFNAASLMKPGQILLVGGLDLQQGTEEPNVLLVMFQLEKVQPVETGQVLHGVGVNSDAGLTGWIQLDESNFKKKLVTEVYPVADLVVPVPRKLSIPGKKPDTAPPVPEPRFEPLIELIKQNVTSDAWDESREDYSSIMPYPKMLALVVRHTREGHEQLAELLMKLRAVQEKMLQLNMQVVVVDDMQAWLKEWDLSQSYEDRKLLQQLQAHNTNHGIVLNSKQVASMKQMWEQKKGVNRLQLSKLTLFNGQSTELSLFGEPPPDEKPQYRVQVRPELLQYQTVRLSYIINAKDALDALSQINTAIIPKGKSVLIDVTDHITDKESAFLFQQWVRQTQLSFPKKNKRCFLLVTPSVLKVSDAVKQPATLPRPSR
ncbi:Regulatory protein BlaR1 [Gimesia alba]|uniref:Regulatory protein BlaR1 n=1 Tax=Gimesia alba TaxID=2527973 RepID=A0A517RNK5_9PLAN|nr:M56 family metallopeptidase [Gimesia alba]QDT45412.1 Regulatory protein BlaR1 [Gimesia alba]